MQDLGIPAGGLAQAVHKALVMEAIYSYPYLYPYYTLCFYCVLALGEEVVFERQPPLMQPFPECKRTCHDRTTGCLLFIHPEEQRCLKSEMDPWTALLFFTRPAATPIWKDGGASKAFVSMPRSSFHDTLHTWSSQGLVPNL